MIIFNKEFKNPVKIITAFDNEGFKKAFQQIELLRKSHIITGYVRYEAKNVFLNRPVNSDAPLLYFEVFEKGNEDFAEFFRPNGASIGTQEALIKSPADKIAQRYIFPAPTINFDEFKDAINALKKEISEGNTYEVNYTYDHAAEFFGDSSELFLSLLSEQKTPYNAFIQNKYEEILSFSPELFFELENNKILTKPMKGTVKRVKNPKKDEENKNFLKNDLKNRAENVMIVDLLRNDLGRIAKTGTVKVTKLFEIETHKTLHQMTSQIEAELPENIDLYKIFEAIFPCGSITGAPKISTMQIIEKIEKGKREVYCGAIGVISPQKTVFSVPIRILQRKKGETAFKYRVGGAIVWDSTPESEWEETIVKTKFLTENHAGLKIIETVKICDGKPVFGQEHFFRMKKSAKILGFAFDEAYGAEIFNFSDSKTSGAASRFFKWAGKNNNGIMRVLLSKNGQFEVTFREFDEAKSFKITISNEKVSSKEPLLRHKTTYRPYFEHSFEKIKNSEIYDEIFLNEKGELTEGARSNIVIEKDGKFFTPSIECGLLNGIFRQKLLNSGKCEEKILKIPDLKAANAIYCVNSVRGMVKVCF